MRILKAIFNFVWDIIKTFNQIFLIAAIITTCVLTILNNRSLGLLDEKTDVMSEAITNYHKYVVGIVKEEHQRLNIEKMLKANVLIVNKTGHSMGSGVIIKIRNKTYILSVAHLGKRHDKYIIREGSHTYGLKLVKMDKKVDLALFRFIDIPLGIEYIKIADKEPSIGDKITCIGNPAGMEDAVTDGVIMKQTKNSYFITAKIYMGNSGGGLYNQKGELVGINHALMTVVAGLDIIGGPTFSVGKSVNLKTIKRFIRYL